MYSLLTALRQVDKTYSRSTGVFEQILAKKKLVRFFVRTLQKLQPTNLYVCIVALYGLKAAFATKPPAQNIQILATATTANEFKMVDYIQSCGANHAIGTVNISNKNILDIINVLRFVFANFRLGKIKKYYRILYHCRDRSFIVACLLASCLTYYVKLKAALITLRPKAILITSTYSPDSMALAAAAKSLGIPVILAPHANVSDLHLIIYSHYDVCVFTGESVTKTFNKQVKNFNPNIIYRGIGGDTKPLELEALNDSPKKVGIFLTGKTNMSALTGLVEQLASKWAPETILIRPHPVDLVRPDFVELADNPLVSISPKGTALVDDVEAIDLAIIGNSSVHLEVLKRGKPALYYENLDFYDDDFNRFVHHKIVPKVQDITKVKLENIADFYSNDWVERFRYFDGGYDIPEGEIKKQIAQAIKKLTA